MQHFSYNSFVQVAANLDKPLSTIEQKTVQIELKLLRQIANVKARRVCLEAFCEHFDLMKWIKEQTESKQITHNIL